MKNMIMSTIYNISNKFDHFIAAIIVIVISVDALNCICTLENLSQSAKLMQYGMIKSIMNIILKCTSTYPYLAYNIAQKAVSDIPGTFADIEIILGSQPTSSIL